ncbi:hypothetical protein MMC27_001426 [Xylographa pallens]|nr:hypothetical protein [Xylographa pallens]
MRLFQILIFLSSALLALAANTENYNAAAAAAAKKKVTLQVGHQYAFKVDAAHNHRRLIVGAVTGSPGSLDFKGNMFEMAIMTPGKLGPMHQGATCAHSSNRPEEFWDCTRPSQNFRFKGETNAALTHADIKAMGQQLIVDNDCYNIVTNNCRTHIKEIFKQIKTRNLLDEASDLFGRDVQFVERDPSEWDPIYERDFEPLDARDSWYGWDSGMEKRGLESDSMFGLEIY